MLQINVHKDLLFNVFLFLCPNDTYSPLLTCSACKLYDFMQCLNGKQATSRTMSNRAGVVISFNLVGNHSL